MIYLISVLLKNIGKSEGRNIELYQLFAVILMNRLVKLQSYRLLIIYFLFAFSF